MSHVFFAIIHLRALRSCAVNAIRHQEHVATSTYNIYYSCSKFQNELYANVFNSEASVRMSQVVFLCTLWLVGCGIRLRISYVIGCLILSVKRSFLLIIDPCFEQKNWTLYTFLASERPFCSNAISMNTHRLESYGNRRKS